MELAQYQLIFKSNQLVNCSSMKNVGFVLIIAAFIGSCGKKNTGGISQPVIPPAMASVQYRGADLSFLPEIEQAGTSFYGADGMAVDALAFVKAKGTNIIRLRLWHNSSTGHSNYKEIETFAQRIKSAGLNWWLDFHYSDTWADPGNQTIPAAWRAASQTVLLDSVYNYTYNVLSNLKAKNILPAIVQIGNENNSGMLWDKGKVGGSFDVNWPNYAALVKKGIDAVKAVDASIKVMLHVAGTSGAQWFYNNIKNQGISYDIIGLSYYPFWHNRNLTELQTDLDALANNFNKDIFIAETAYPFTTGWNDYTNNVVGASASLLNGYEATPAGQVKFLTDLRTVINKIPNNHGLGFCYWAPDWMAYRGSTATNGSSWENLALFDFNNKALEGWNAFVQ
jgi:arabinogalactan endo-1,4-beta-galactosidase